MNNLVILPMILPVVIGVFLVFFQRFVQVQRWISLLSLIASTGVSAYILYHVQHEGIMRLDFGGWAPPFGISFVADSFSALLVVTTCLTSIFSLVYAFSSIGEDREKMYVYPLIQLLIAGVNGSFLTADMFNLFVCFEIMLLASYALITLGGTKQQLREAIKYVLINVVASSLFLFAIAYLYGTVGTLNFAHLSLRIAETGQTPLLTTIGILFLIVFSLKAGLLLYIWLPGSYSAPPTAIAALFGALLTKVGIYALFRTFTLLFYHEPTITHTLIGIMAAITMIGGSIGAVAYNDIQKIVAYNVVISVGFILTGLAVFTPAGIEGSIYYLVHDIVAKALLFLLAGTIFTLTATNRLERISGLIRNYPLFGWLFFITMISLAGIPPLSGFIGKVLVAQGAIENQSYVLLAIALISSLFVLYSLLRVFRNCFWGETIISEESAVPLKAGMLIPCVLLTAISFGLGLGVEGISAYVSDAAHTLMNPDVYIEAVLSEGS
ncbi:Na+/H+ antiporter subunit D [Shouchella shacheensis]|uniref:Na+/H+ antiporter subunit D n=1 Tax=Shouchella shacheensis TaxID=1649580 RepID=UPI00073FD4FB|nr:Na+/H+ antiporter subunit D [Shouchella shacheensis]